MWLFSLSFPRASASAPTSVGNAVDSSFIGRCSTPFTLLNQFCGLGTCTTFSLLSVGCLIFFLLSTHAGLFWANDDPAILALLLISERRSHRAPLLFFHFRPTTGRVSPKVPPFFFCCFFFCIPPLAPLPSLVAVDLSPLFPLPALRTTKPRFSP